VLPFALLCLLFLKGKVMPNQNISPDTHRMIPVSGLGVVAVPIGTKFTDLHPALMRHLESAAPVAPAIADDSSNVAIPSDPNYNPDNITAAGAVENSEPFKKATRDAWDSTGAGYNRGQEAGFSLDKYGHEFGKVKHETRLGDSTEDTLGQPVTDATIAMLHTHPNDVDARPSHEDINVAKKTKRVVMVASRSGLWEVGPDGSVSRIYKDPSWMDKKN
jgi:hypothetical protein